MGTLMAGNDFPDIIHIYNGIGTVPNPAFFKAQCADLTPYLGGDAIKDYPNLAAIPTYAWHNSVSVVDGKLYQWPIHRYLPLLGRYKNTDIWDKQLGAGYVPHDADDFMRCLKAVNNPSGGVFAMGNAPGPPFNFGMFENAAMFGAPNNWRYDQDKGTLVKDFETEEFKAAVGWMRDTWGAGLWHPDSLTYATSRDAFSAGKFVTCVEGFGNSWNDFWRRGLQAEPQNHLGFLAPFSATAGTPPQAFLTGGFVSSNVMKKASPVPYPELLRILDWLAAPFGTQEDMLLSYGLEGTDYTLDSNGQPKPTVSGINAAGYVPWRYLSQHPYVQYQADLPGTPRRRLRPSKRRSTWGLLIPHSGTTHRRNTPRERLRI